MKTCVESGCTNPQFGGGYCKYHNFRRHMKGGDLYTPKKRQKPINKESPKRKVEHKYYSQLCREMEAEIRAENDGKIYCFFSGEEIKGFVVWHHLKGRVGYYTDKEWLVPVINERHNEYHFKRVEWLMKQPWYTGFLTRLKAKSDLLYRFELRKQEKAELQFED